MPAPASLPRRLALPLGLSLTAHALLVGLACLLPGSPSLSVNSDENRPFCSIRLFPFDPPKPKSRIEPKQLEKEKNLVMVAPPLKPTVPIAIPDPPRRRRVEPGGLSDAAVPRGGIPGSRAAGHPGRGLLVAPAEARRVVYLVDRSLSMGLGGALATARVEVAASLSRLTSNVIFQVIPYNRGAEPMEIDGRRELAPVDPATIEQVIAQLGDVRPEGVTDHANALRRGLLLRPDVLFLITDGNDLPPVQVPVLLRINQGRSTVHVIELSRALSGEPGPLARLAESTGGTYRRVTPDR